MREHVALALSLHNLSYMFSHWSRPTPNSCQGGWVIDSYLHEIWLITPVVLDIKLSREEKTDQRFDIKLTPTLKLFLNVLFLSPSSELGESWVGWLENNLLGEKNSVPPTWTP